MDSQHPFASPTPLCAAYAPHLALLGSSMPDAELPADVRAHLAGCAWCQAKLASFGIVDAALKRHFAPLATPSAAAPALADLIAGGERDTSRRPLSHWPGRRGRSGVRRWSGAALAVACTLALIVAAAGIFGALPHRFGAPIGSVTPKPAITQTATIAPTATPVPACAQLPGGATPFYGLAAVPDLTLPVGSYIGAPVTTGGREGQYTVQSYTVCFPGDESAIDGDLYQPPANPTSALGKLERHGWTHNNLFPDDYTIAALENCTVTLKCLNNAGTPNPFTFLSVDKFTAQPGGATTFQLQVATIDQPACLNNPTYYSGTPQYSLYEEGNDFNTMTPTYYFQMPPATRMSNHVDSASGSTVKYFCSAGSQATVVNFMVGALGTESWTLSDITASGFVATKGTSPAFYEIDVNVPSANNYSLRFYPPR